MKRILLTCFMLATVLITTETFAQNRTVTGQVTGADDGLPLPQVTVLLKGTGQGVPTDADGNYRISVPAGGGGPSSSATWVIPLRRLRLATVQPLM